MNVKHAFYFLLRTFIIADEKTVVLNKINDVAHPWLTVTDKPTSYFGKFSKIHSVSQTSNWATFSGSIALLRTILISLNIAFFRFASTFACTSEKYVERNSSPTPECTYSAQRISLSSSVVLDEVKFSVLSRIATINK